MQYIKKLSNCPEALLHILMKKYTSSIRYSCGATSGAIFANDTHKNVALQKLVNLLQITYKSESFNKRMI